MTNNTDHHVLRPELEGAFRSGEARLNTELARHDAVFKARDVIFRSGAKPEFVYQLRTGWVARTRLLAARQQQIIAIYLPGDLFGLDGLLRVKQPERVECLTDASVSYIDRDRLLAMARTDDEIAIRLMWQLVDGEGRLHDRISGFGSVRADQRLAAMLLDFHHRLQRVGL